MDAAAAAVTGEGISVPRAGRGKSSSLAGTADATRVAQAQAEEKRPTMDSTPFMDKTIYRMTLIANRKRLQESTVKEISPCNYPQ